MKYTRELNFIPQESAEARCVKSAVDATDLEKLRGLIEQVSPHISGRALDCLRRYISCPLEEFAARAVLVLSKPYGRNHILEIEKDFGIGCAAFGVNQETSFHFHVQRTEFYLVRKGSLELYRAENIERLTCGESSYNTAGQAHKLFNPGPNVLEVLEIFCPPLLDDKIRLSDRHGRSLGQVTRSQ